MVNPLYIRRHILKHFRELRFLFLTLQLLSVYTESASRYNKKY
jgi:hypothetical protein